MRTPLLLLVGLLIVAIPGCDSTSEDNDGGTESTDQGTIDDEAETEDAEQDEDADQPDGESTTGPLDEQTREQALLDPSLVTDQAPDEYQILFETTKGDFTVAVDRQWGPGGADRLYNLARIGFFDDVAFFRVIDGFMAQFGLHGDPEVNAAWRSATISDDEVTRSNKRGKLTFATSGPDSRTTQIFINFSNNTNLDGMGFAPIGEVIDGMDVVDSLYDGYGEGAPQGDGPSQQRIQMEGNDYLRDQFENLDYVERVSIVDP